MKNNKVIRSSFLVMIFIILGKIFALVRDSLIAAKFGATYITDIYNFALGMVYLLTTISYGLTTTFIPIHTELLENKDENDRNNFVNNVLNVFTIATIILTILMIFFSKEIIYVCGHGFKNDLVVFNTSVKITRIMLISLIFISLQSVVTGILQAHKEFYEPSAMALVSNIVYILYLIFFTNRYGIIGFAVATVVAFLMQFLINIPKYKKLGYRYSNYMDLKDTRMRQMFKLSIPVIISTSVIQLNAFVNRAFATNIYYGAVTVLDCANKINTLAYEVFAIGIAMIVYPVLSELAVKGDMDGYKRALQRSINIILLIMVPAAVGIALLREPLINVIFKRGAFTEEAAKLTSQALLLYTPAMIAYGVRDILNKAYYSVKDTKTPMINSFIGIGINIIINIVLIKYMGVSALTLATTISSIIITILMFNKLSKKLRGINTRDIVIVLLKIVVASLIMAVVIIMVNKLFISKLFYGFKRDVLSIVISTLVGVITYAVSIFILKVDEINDVLGKLMTNKGKK